MIDTRDTKLDCGHKPSPHGEHTTGTAHTTDGKVICWECAAMGDLGRMLKDGNSKLARIGTADFLRSVVTGMQTDTWEDRVQSLEAEGLTRSDAQAVVDAEDAKTAESADVVKGAAFRAIPGLMRRRIAQDVTAAALRELAGEYPAIAHACQSAIFTRRR